MALVCPQCSRNDLIQKVSHIYSSGTAHIVLIQAGRVGLLTHGEGSRTAVQVMSYKHLDRKWEDTLLLVMQSASLFGEARTANFSSLQINKHIQKAITI